MGTYVCVCVGAYICLSMRGWGGGVGNTVSVCTPCVSIVARRCLASSRWGFESHVAIPVHSPSLSLHSVSKGMRSMLSVIQSI